MADLVDGDVRLDGYREVFLVQRQNVVKVNRYLVTGFLEQTGFPTKYNLPIGSGRLPPYLVEEGGRQTLPVGPGRAE